MEIRRFVTAENASGDVSIRSDEPIPDTQAALPVTILWGWDSLPSLPIGPGDISGDPSTRPLFPPAGGVNVNLCVFPPAGEAPRDMPAPDMSHSGIVAAEGRPTMHRTNTVDLAFVLEGEVVLTHPGEDAEITLRRGDFLVQNGGMHEWQNRSSEPCVAAFVIFTTARED